MNEKDPDMCYIFGKQRMQGYQYDIFTKMTKTKTKTKNEKDQTCAMFSESRGCKDIVHDLFTTFTTRSHSQSMQHNIFVIKL